MITLSICLSYRDRKIQFYRAFMVCYRDWGGIDPPNKTQMSSSKLFFFGWGVQELLLAKTQVAQVLSFYLILLTMKEPRKLLKKNRKNTAKQIMSSAVCASSINKCLEPTPI